MTATLAPPDALDLLEAIDARPSPLSADGSCIIHIIRPGLGLGKGAHWYPASMLQENAHVFTGWNVYLDHESPEAKRRRGGLPRSMRDLGGLIEASWWDPTIPADARHPEDGGVVGRLRPIRELREIIAELPQAAKFSIRAKATDVQEGRAPIGPRRTVWMVEGIRDNPPGSVDAVTEAGAGGRIAEIQESLEADDAAAVELELAEAKIDAAARKKLPSSAFAIPETREYPIHDESHARNALTRVAQHGNDEQKKRVRAAVKKRYPNIDIQESTDSSPAEGAGEGGNEVKELEEALRDPESPVSRAVKDLVEARAEELAEGKVEERAEEKATELAEAKIAEAKEEWEEEHKTELTEAVEEARAEERQRVERRELINDMREEAQSLIESAELPEKLAKRLQEAYTVEDGEPSDRLDLVDRIDSDGNLVKSAKDQLREAVEKDIQEARDLMADLNPTKVEGEGAGGGGDEGARESTPARGGGEKPFWREHLEEARIDVKEAYAGVGAGESSEED